MAERTGIEWCDATFNPWMGCTKVSPACDHCYAERDTRRFGRVEWGPGQPRVRTSASNWRQPLLWNARAEEFGQCDVCGWRGQRRPRWAVCPTCHNGLMKPARRRVFCASLADVFDTEVDPQWRIDLLELIAETPNLDWLLLTKRIGNAERLLDQALDVMSHGLTRWRDVPWPNVWLGATICNQAEADRDIPKLLATPARVRFLSMEPLLGHVDLARWIHPRQTGNGDGYGGDVAVGWTTDFTTVDWVIVGGESGPHARPTHPYWARSLRDQCAAAGVQFLFKQWGEWAPALSGVWFHPMHDMPLFSARAAGRDTHDFGSGIGAVRIGKKAAGRLLDGVEHTHFPGGPNA